MPEKEFELNIGAQRVSDGKKFTSKTTVTASNFSKAVWLGIDAAKVQWPEPEYANHSAGA